MYIAATLSCLSFKNVTSIFSFLASALSHALSHFSSFSFHFSFPPDLDHLGSTGLAVGISSSPADHNHPAAAHAAAPQAVPHTAPVTSPAAAPVSVHHDVTTTEVGSTHAGSDAASGDPSPFSLLK